MARKAGKDKLTEAVKNDENGRMPENAIVLILAKMATMAQTARIARVARLTKWP